MYMDMLGEGLTPCVQDSRHAEFRAEMLRIATEARESRGRRIEQQIVDETRVALGERVEIVRQGEDDVEVVYGKQFGAPGFDPSLLGEALALGAMAVATRIVGDLGGPAGVADLPMSAQGGSATVLDGPHGSVLGLGQRVGSPIALAMSPEDIGQLDPAPTRYCRFRRGRQRPTHRLYASVGSGRSSGERVATMRP